MPRNFDSIFRPTVQKQAFNIETEELTLRDAIGGGAPRVDLIRVVYESEGLRQNWIASAAH